MTNEEQRRHNSSYPKGGVSCFADSFVVNQSSVLRKKFGGKNPALRVAAKRWAALKNQQTIQLIIFGTLN